MVEASIVKSAVSYDKKLDPVFLCVVHYGDEALNVRYRFDWDSFDLKKMLRSLREQIAEDFDIGVKYVDVREEATTEILMHSYIRYIDNFGDFLH